MKKVENGARADYRREIQQLINSSGLSAREISEKCGFSLTTVYNWMNGEKLASKANYERLKERLNTVSYSVKPDSTPRIERRREPVIRDTFRLPGSLETKITEAIIKAVVEFPGKIEELQKEIRDLKASVDKLNRGDHNCHHCH